MRVADIGGKEFEEAHAGAIAGSGDQRRHRGRADRDEMVHRFITLAALCWRAGSGRDAKKLAISRLVRSLITGTF